MPTDPAELSLQAQTPAEAAGPAWDSGDPAKALAALRVPALACIRCDLKLTRTQVVFGTGNPHSRLILFGEAPGAGEDESGVPFVGRAGQVLDGLLAGAGIARADIWISNTVKCRPVKIEGRRVSNRPPRVGEVRACAIWRDGEMAAIAPRLICCLGATAASTILGRTVKMTAERGQWFDGPGDSRVLITYHPSYVMRQVGPDYDRVRGEALADLREVAAQLAAR